MDGHNPGREYKISKTNWLYNLALHEKYFAYCEKYSKTLTEVEVMWDDHVSLIDAEQP